MLLTGGLVAWHGCHKFRQVKKHSQVSRQRNNLHNTAAGLAVPAHLQLIHHSRPTVLWCLLPAAPALRAPVPGSHRLLQLGHHLLLIVQHPGCLPGTEPAAGSSILLSTAEPQHQEPAARHYLGGLLSSRLKAHLSWPLLPPPPAMLASWMLRRLLLLLLLLLLQVAALRRVQCLDCCGAAAVQPCTLWGLHSRSCS
jgi:hypothetical protein